MQIAVLIFLFFFNVQVFSQKKSPNCVYKIFFVGDLFRYEDSFDRNIADNFLKAVFDYRAFKINSYEFLEVLLWYSSWLKHYPEIRFEAFEARLGTQLQMNSNQSSANDFILSAIQNWTELRFKTQLQKSIQSKYCKDYHHCDGCRTNLKYLISLIKTEAEWLLDFEKKHYDYIEPHLNFYFKLLFKSVLEILGRPSLEEFAALYNEFYGSSNLYERVHLEF